MELTILNMNPLQKNAEQFLKDFSESINQLQLDIVYTEWSKIARMSILTKLFFRAGVDPLKYLSDVPQFYAKRLDLVDSIFIPSNIKAIGTEAFKDSNLRQLIFAEQTNCKRVGALAFSGTPLKKIVIPDSVRILGMRAFLNCTSLEEVSIPSTNDFIIEDRAFEGCFRLETIQYRGTAAEYQIRASAVFDPAWAVKSSIKYIECTDQIIKI